MAKSGRHKKIRKQEKAKTQLKSGIRKLDKPQNIIDPKLRVKKILLREQLKDNVEGEVATRRHQSLQDILTSLNHHNTNIKKDGLSGLQEIISSSVETLYDNLDRILEKIAGLTSDIEDSVRRENLRVAEIIFAQVSEDQVKPFWNLILTHIKCTLTNLSPIIRYGSLSFMSLLISYFPNLVSHSIQILLPNILGLISSSVVSTVSASKSPKTPTTTPEKKNKLKIEISGKHNDAKERLRVLSLISACLDLYTTKQSSSSSKTPSNSHEDNGTIRIVWRDDSSHLGLYSPFGYVESQSVSPYYGPEGLRSVINTTSLSLKQSGSDTVFQGDGNRSFNVVGSSSDENQSFWPQFLQSCLPLLYETWLEVRPSAEDEKRGNVKLESAARGVNNLPKGTVEILECIVTVMTRLFIQGNLLGHNTWNSRHGEDGGGEDTSHIRQLRKNQGQELRKYFFDSLPFSAVLDSQKKTVTSVNLQLFSIAAQLRLVDKSLMLRLQQYLQVLISNSALDSGQTSQVLEILSFIHLSNVGTLTSGVLSYALDSGHYEAVNGFLGRTLTLGQESSAEQNLMLKTIEWDSIVPKIFERITSVTPTLLTVLTFIALRNLTDLKPVLESNLDKFDSFLNADSSLGDWDQVARLFYFTGCLKSMKYFQVTIPKQVLETVQVLTA